jgi:glucosamine 6-phosphate synthetase-like amidotransferase/phosphosugar isomerase protein
VVAIQNGELDYLADLRRELGRDGHAFASRCDTEVLPHLYEQDGFAFPSSSAESSVSPSGTSDDVGRSSHVIGLE